ncbi:MAG: hypothetical protein ABIP06_01615 [Pyrinomonadaceae bacterium]
MPKPKPEPEYTSNNSFMTSRVKVPKPFGSDYEDPLEVLKAGYHRDENIKSKSTPTAPTTPTTPSPGINTFLNKDEEIKHIIIPTVPSPTIPTTPSKILEPTSPTRDFQKVTNSITRIAIPSGIFGSGKAKQLYDALYSLTRGAIKPIRVIRITKPRLMKLAGIGTRQTLWLNLEHLESVGLVRKNVLLGEHGGNEYEVFIPEELPELATTPTTPTSPSNMVYQVQNIEGVVGVEPSPTAPSSELINTCILDAPKTSFKDNTKNDDEAFAAFIEKFQSASKEITGKNLSKRETENLGNLADLLILELKAAARRTDSISSVPAFLTEVLRRQFFASRQQAPSSNKPSKIKADTVGKADNESFEVKPLDQKGREAALEQLREFVDDEFLQDFKKWYTEEDWQWSMKELGID